jgi:hypothetical protein
MGLYQALEFWNQLPIQYTPAISKRLMSPEGIMISSQHRQDILAYYYFLIFIRIRRLILPEVILFYMSIAEFEQLSLTLCIGGLMLLMVFILYRLGKDSGAGKFGTFVLFLSLGMGIFGFAAKSVIKLIVDI